MNLSLDGLYIDGHSSENVDLSGMYNEQMLIDIMVENWVPYFECHKCGKWDYCKYAKKHPANPNRSVDIQCGIAVNFITNYVNTTFSLIGELSKSAKQSYLNSAYHMTCFTQNAEQLVGSFINEEYHDFLGSYAPTLYGMSKDTMNYLAEAHKEMKNVPFFNSKKSVLFVEGTSEKIFADTFLGIEVKNYEGQGRITYPKIEYLFKEYIDKGYKIYVQADKDGKVNNENINKIIAKGLIPEKNIFCFKYDFETAIPVHIFHQLLVDSKFIVDSYDNYISEYNGKISIVKYTESKYGITLNKPSLATKICEFIDASSRQSNLYYDEDFLKTEIGQFWYFLKTKIVH